MLIGLNRSGAIVGICTETLLNFILWEEIPLRDLVLSVDPSNGECHLLCLTEPDAQTGKCELRHISYPTFETIYKLNVAPCTYIVELQNSNEQALLLESVSDSSGIIRELRLKQVIECDPVERLKRLVKRGRFAEAEQFAVTWDLPTELIWRAKARRCSEASVCELDLLKQALDHVSDVHFVSECCNDATADCIADVRRLLEYERGRIRRAMASRPDDAQLWRLQSDNVQALRKLDTWTLLNQIQGKETVGTAAVHDWEEFLRSHELNLTENFVRENKLIESSLLLYHLSETSRLSLDIDFFERVLAAVGLDVCHTELNCWLSALLTQVLTISPDKVATVLERWVMFRLEALKAQHSAALDFAERIIATVQATASKIHEQFIGEASAALNRIKNVVTALNNVKYLYEEFGIRITLRSYSEDPQKVAFQLLESVATSDVSRLHTSFLEAWMKDRALEPDTILARYIEENVHDNCERWETHMCEVARCLRSVRARLIVVLVVMGRAEVPWCTALEALVTEAEYEEHPLAEDIRIQHENLPFRVILERYVGRRDAVSVLWDDEILIRLARRVLQSKTTEAVKDVEAIAEKRPSILMKIENEIVHHLIEMNELTEALKRLDGLKDEKQLEQLCRNILFRASEYVRYDYLPERTRAYRDMLSPTLRRIKPIICEYEFEACVREVRILLSGRNVEETFGESLRKIAVEAETWPAACSQSMRVALDYGRPASDGLFDLLKYANGKVSHIVFVQK